MKKVVLFAVLLITVCFSAQAFQPLAKAPTGDIPPFKMRLTNGRMFSAANLPQNKPVILIYFAPDCDHCQQLMNAFFKKAESFKKAAVVMVTFRPVDDLVGFERTFGTAKYPNITVGTEGNSFFLRSYYRLQKTPFTALYSKDGKLVHSYREETSVDDLLKRLNSLK